MRDDVITQAECKHF